jgi:uncharacterized LabA/DUF88 family protein
LNQVRENNFEAFKAITEIIGASTEKTVKTLSSKNLLDNVAIFVDYDNVYWTLKKYYNHDPDHKVPEKNLFNCLWERYGKDHVRNFRVYADFQKIRTSLTNLQKNRVQIRHVYSNGKDGENRKNSSDIELCIDAIESTYKDPNITCYVFVTADSDMIPIMSRMMYKGKRVELFYLSEAAPKYVDMGNYVHHCEDLIDFLKIERKVYDIEEYIIPALQIIIEWDQKYGNTDRFLGTSWLKNELSSRLEIPELIASDLIERLQTDKLIEDNTKTLSNRKTKTTIVVSKTGHQFLKDITKETAASVEK